MNTLPRPCHFVPGIASALFFLCSLPAFGADHAFQPKITVGEEYTDNVFDDLSNKTDFITRVQPGFLFKYGAPLWDWSLDYAYDYRYYVNRSKTRDDTQQITGSGLIKVIEERAFIALDDVYKKVALNIARDTTNESLFINQTDQNLGSVSPFLVLNPTHQLSLKTGYRYVNNWYKNPLAVSRQDHLAFLNGAYELSPKFSLTCDYTFTREITQKNSSFFRHEAYLGPRYEYADKSFLFAKGGVIATNYDNGVADFNPSWSAGLTHTFDTTVVSLSGGTSFTDDPLGTTTFRTLVKGTLTKTLPRGNVDLFGSYSRLSTGFSDFQTLNQQNNITYTGGFTGAYELLAGFRGSLGFTYQNFRDQVARGTTDRYYADAGLTYDFGRDLVAGVTYKYSDYISSDIPQDNRKINRVIFEVKKVF